MASVWEKLIYTDITGGRVRSYPELRDFRDPKRQVEAYNAAQRAVSHRYRRWIIVFIALMLASIVIDAIWNQSTPIAFLGVAVILAPFAFRAKTVVRAELQKLYFDEASNCDNCGRSLIGNPSSKCPGCDADVVESPHCRKCDYLLIGCVNNRCPECGTAIPDHHLRLIRGQPYSSDLNLNPIRNATDNEVNGTATAPGRPA